MRKLRLIEDSLMGFAQGYTTEAAEPELNPSSSFSVQLEVINLFAQDSSIFSAESPMSQETLPYRATRDGWSP